MADLPEQHSKQDFGAVRGNPHTRDSYKSTISMNHPTLKPKTNFQKRKGAGGANHGAGGPSL